MKLWRLTARPSVDQADVNVAILTNIKDRAIIFINKIAEEWHRMYNKWEVVESYYTTEYSKHCFCFKS